MTQKIFITTTDGDSREDGNVYYAGLLLVSSDTLKFDEPEFGDGVLDVGMDNLVGKIESYGYKVEQPEFEVISCASD